MVTLVSSYVISIPETSNEGNIIRIQWSFGKINVASFRVEFEAADGNFFEEESCYGSILDS
jgi:hypothetical protein